jgi:Family of unknown function (DUF6062)
VTVRWRSRVKAPAAGRPSSRHAARRPPSSVVTAWLRQGLRAGMCPLCRVAHKADREYIWHFFDEGSDQGESIDAVRQACGFCAEHIEMLRRIEIDGMKSTLAISTMFADTFAGIVDDLESLNARSEFHREPCPACANRDEQLHTNARYFLDELATTAIRRETFERSPGLCFDHFELVWDTAETTEDRELILRVQRNAARSLLDELGEHVRKHDHKFRDEPKGAERDSWLRAIYLTAGWPPPTTSAAEPERT